MKLHTCRPPVGDLVFQVYGRSLHPELFDILGTHRIERDECTITIYITRSGHVVSWERGKVIVTEVAASLEEPLPEHRRLLSYRLRGEHYGASQCTPDVHYQMSFQVETVSQEVFMHVHDEILADGATRGFLCNFQPNHRLSLAPLGFVALECRPSAVVVHAFHTFPDEHAIVKSQSLIELQK